MKEHQFKKAINFLKQYESQLIVPDMNVTENTNAQSSIIGYPEKSFLGEKGYTTKLSRKKRWEILQEEILTEYPPQTVINKLADFIRRFKAQRNGSKRYAAAIAEWEYDIERVREAYKVIIKGY